MTEIIPHWLIKRKELTPNRIALISNQEQWTFKELHEEAVQLAYRMHQQGIKQGMHVGLLLNNSPDFIKIVHALSYLGAVIVCLNTRLTESELQFQIEDSDVAHLITEEIYNNSYSFTQVPISTISNIYKAAPLKTELQTEINLSNPFTIMYTSGTTGRPKGVIHTYGNHWWSATASALNLGIEQNDTWLSCLPMFHIGGFSIIVRTSIYGMGLHLFNKFDDGEIHNALMSNQITIISVVAVMLERLLDRLEEESCNYPPAVRCFLLGGSPVSESILKRAQIKKIPVYQSYGLTETTSQIATNIREETPIVGSSGKPLFAAKLKIVNRDASGVGQIAVTGPMVTKGYYNREEETEKSFQDGWLLTGDIGRLDKEGNLFVLERRTDLIISGGENIYPQEIERELETIKHVEAAGVVGVKSKKWGEVPVAFIEVKQQINEGEVLLYLEKNIAKYKLPKRVFVTESLPRNAMGKLQRAKLKELAAQSIEPFD